MTENDRELTTEERRLLQWMLENGDEQAHRYLWQIERAMVKPWRCSCGCASFDLRIADRPDVDGEMNVLADYVYGSATSAGLSFSPAAKLSPGWKFSATGPMCRKRCRARTNYDR